MTLRMSNFIFVLLAVTLSSCRTKTVAVDVAEVGAGWHVSQSIWGARLADTLIITKYQLSDTDTVAISQKCLVRHAVSTFSAQSQDTIAAHVRHHNTKKSTTVPKSPINVETMRTVGDMFFKGLLPCIVGIIVAYLNLKLWVYVKNRTRS